MFKFKGISSDTMKLAVKTEVDPAITTPRVETVKILGASGLIPVTDGVDARRAEFRCVAIGTEAERRALLVAAGEWLQGSGTLEVHGGTYEMTCSGINQNAMTVSTGEFTVSFVENGIKTTTGTLPPLTIKGEKGDKGDPGDSAYEVWRKARGGSLEEFLEYTKGQKGDPGTKGETGEQGATGDRGEQGAKGDKGDPGKSAYQIWLDAGNQGSESDFLESLKNGPKGADGKSAYQIWLDAGNQGNEQAFLAAIKGERGEQGPRGADGAQGPQGVKGDRGERGEPGAQGATGAQGRQGKKGDQGNAGKSAYQIWIEEGNTGNVTDFLASLKGEKGDPGGAGGSVLDPNGMGDLRYYGNRIQVRQGNTWIDVAGGGIDFVSVTDALMSAGTLDVENRDANDLAGFGTFTVTDNLEVTLK